MVPREQGNQDDREVNRGGRDADHEPDPPRRDKATLHGTHLRTLDDAHRFMESAGFCLM